MNEYIKKEEAESIILGRCEESALWGLRRLRTYDVVEVRHGTNKGYEDSYGWKDVCSLCGCEFRVSKSANYCPNCGARMDGEEE